VGGGGGGSNQVVFLSLAPGSLACGHSRAIFFTHRRTVSRSPSSVTRRATADKTPAIAAPSRYRGGSDSVSVRKRRASHATAGTSPLASSPSGAAAPATRACAQSRQEREFWGCGMKKSCDQREGFVSCWLADRGSTLEQIEKKTLKRCQKS
jgi:hypothetical protein